MLGWEVRLSWESGRNDKGGGESEFADETG